MQEKLSHPVNLSSSGARQNVPEIAHRLDAAEVAAGLVGSQTSGISVSTDPREAHKRRLKRLKTIVTGAAKQMRRLQTGGFRWRPALLTLTYAPGEVWQARDISELRNHIRGWLGRRGATYHAVWVMELQKRGAPHYHIIIWLPKGLTLPKPDKQGWWKKGMTNIQWARKPDGYLAKYASKGDDQPERLPSGARLYGVNGCPVHLGWWRAPGWLQCLGDPGMKIQRMPGGWWAIHERAIAVRSPWRVIAFWGSSIEIGWRGWGTGDIQPLWVIEREIKKMNSNIKTFH